MAFSTQKDFFYVPFMNENVDFECRRACVQLKSYDSTIDDRSWALDERQRSNFLSDLVACRTPIGGRVGKGEGTDQVAPQKTAAGPPVPAPPPPPPALNIGAQGGDGPPDGNFIGDSFLTQHGIRVGDSILECANATITKLEAVLVEKQILEKQLEVSSERLRSITDENMNIKNIMQQKFDSSQTKDFYNKIQQLSASGKVTKGEENELLAIHHKMEEMIKAYEILQAENCYLKRLVEKLACRASMQSVKSDPETSTDISYLQDTVNNLRKEVNMLRKLEDEKLKIKYDPNKSRFSDRDTENIKAIIKERNILRDKCKTFKDLEKKVQMLQKKTKDADQLSSNLSNDLDCQSKYICEMEQEMKRMQTYYEEQMQTCKFTEETLKCQIEELKDQLMSAKCCAQRVDVLQMELACLRNEITKRDVALNDYDCQYKQLMDVIAELKSPCGQKKDDETQTCTDAVEELAFFASATLSEIKKELEKRCSKEDIPRVESKPQMSDVKDEFEVHAMQEGPRIETVSKPGKDECCEEKERLQNLLDELRRNEGKEPLNPDDMCADALKRLKELENEAARLKAELNDLKVENDGLKQSLKEKSDKLLELADKLGKIDNDMANTAKETAEMGKDLDQSLQLVKDISDIQVKNQQLATAVNAINSMDDQKLIDDLKAQLEALKNQLAAEEDKNKRCQKENQRLEAELKNRGIPTDDMKQEVQKPKGVLEPKKSDENKVEKHDEPKKEERKVEKAEEPKKPEEKKVEKHDEPKQEEKKADKHEEPKKKETPHEEEKKKTEPRKSEPVKSEAKKTEPAKPEPRKSEPVKSESKKSDPVKAEPRKTEPRKTQPEKKQEEKKEEKKTEKKTEPKKPTEKIEVQEEEVHEFEQESEVVYYDDRKPDTPKSPTSPSKPAERPTVTVDVKKSKDTSAVKNPSAPGKPKAKEKGKPRDSKDEAKVVTTDFVSKNAPGMAVNLKAGSCLEKELRAILDAFIEECGFCFCQCRVPKSKFYGICFNLLHYGLQAITFKELAYMHKKIFIAAERIHPGCLLSMILSDASGPEVDRFKCCVCRNALCCSNSEAMLREKVTKLEREIQMAKEYLDYFKTFPEACSPRSNVTFVPDCFDYQKDGCLTYRTTEPSRPSSKVNCRQLKKLKERIFGASDFLL